MRILGVILIIAGIAGFLLIGVSYTTSEQVIDVGPLQVEREEERTLPITPVASGVLVVVGLDTRRKISYSEWLEMLEEARQRNVLTRPLKPPIPPPWTVIPTCDGQPLSGAEIEKLTEWSVEYYETMYQILFELIDKGFPTTKQRFRCFADTFPVLVVLALGDRSEGQVRGQRMN